MGCFLFTVTEGNKRPSGRRAERHVIKKWIGLQTKSIPQGMLFVCSPAGNRTRI